MKTGNNKATHNFIIRLWSAKHYKRKNVHERNKYQGTLTEVKTGRVVHFDSAGQLLSTIELMYNKLEECD